LKKPSHWGKHFDFSGTMWTAAGVRVKEAEAARLQEQAAK
jgi:hypothetical protein